MQQKRTQEVAAGGVVFRHAAGTVQFCIVNTHGGRDWQFPKGHQEAGESMATTALREVREESGLQAEILDLLEATSYTFQAPDRIVAKTVHFYLMRFISGNLEDHDGEVTEARWVGGAEARQMLTYENERNLVPKALLAIPGA
ncbi:NUDIX hydrolase [Planctomycetota bacterium]